MDVKTRYVVKPLVKDKVKEFGVYDTVRGSYPVENDTLRALGIDRLEYFPSPSGANKVATLLNQNDSGNFQP